MEAAQVRTLSVSSGMERGLGLDGPTSAASDVLGTLDSADGRAHLIALIRRVSVTAEPASIVVAATGPGHARRLRIGAARGSAPDTVDLVIVEVDEPEAVVSRDRERIASVLEEALMPVPLPPIDGLSLEASFRPGEGSLTGDFYDVFALPADAWGLTIGDITGHGVEAAALTTLVRYTLRALALVLPSPTDVLDQTNAVVADSMVDRFASCHFLRLRPARDAMEVEVATAGHPPLLVRRRDGCVEEITAVGPILGLAPSAKYEGARTILHPGDRLLAYTDGVVEARRDDEPFGITRLRAYLGANEEGGQTARLLDDVSAHANSPLDDMAAVLITVTGPSRPRDRPTEP